ncbi:hypothetical protein ACNO8X_22150 [Mycobacterium sp. PDNC021]|uniref:hypothetical protein n=1 Tax=Mycobacterium sp. PDNC021 TaxID=3391399 RepID=UPI003AAB7CCD
MTNGESSTDSSEPVTAVFARLESGRASLVQALTTYNTDGQQLTKATLDRLEWLNKATVSPARTEAVRVLRFELDHFDELWEPLAVIVGDLFGGLQHTLMDLAKRIVQTVEDEAQGLDSPLHALIDAVTKIRDALDRTGGRTDEETLAQIDDALTQGLPASKRLKEGKQLRAALMESALVATDEVAATAEEAANLLIARLNLLVTFLFVSDPTRRGADAEPGWIKTVGKATATEIALKTTEELLKSVPGVGIAVSILSIGKDVREKREQIREKRELVQKNIDAYREPNATDDMSNLVADFEEDNNKIAEFLMLVVDFADKLRLGTA